MRRPLCALLAGDADSCSCQYMHSLRHLTTASTLQHCLCPGGNKAAAARPGGAVIGGQRGSSSDPPNFARSQNSSAAANAAPRKRAREELMCMEPSRSVEPLQYSTEDPRPILLFEISGVLCNTSAERTASQSRAHLPRPGLSSLVQLMPHFRLGVYTTSQPKTAILALDVVASALRGELITREERWRLLLDGTPPAGTVRSA